MVKIRLTRLGDKKAPFYRIVVADSRSPRDGKFIDVLGTFNPLISEKQVELDTEKAKKWIADGAQATDTVKAILVKAGVLEQGKPAPAKTKAVKKKKGE